MVYPVLAIYNLCPRPVLYYKVSDLVLYLVISFCVLAGKQELHPARLI